MPEQGERRIEQSARPYAGAGLVLAAGLAVSLLLWQYAERRLADNNERLLDRQAGLVESGLRQRLNEFHSILLGMQGLYVSSDAVSRVEFHRYLENLRLQGRTVGILALHYTRHVLHADKAAFVAAVRGDRSLDPRGYPDFAIHPEGGRAEYYVIEFIEPFAENRLAFGLDAGTQAANRASFLAARDHARTYLTPPFQLAQTGLGRLGLVLRAPIYRNDAMTGTPAQRRAGLRGFVGLTLEADGLLAGIMGAPALAGLRAILRDLGQDDGQVKPDAAATTIAEGGDNEIRPLLTNTRRIEAAGRRWELSLSAGEAWLAGQPGRNEPRAFLAAGSVISLLLAMLHLVLARARVSALALANDMTHGLRRSEARFRDLTELSVDWYWEQDAHFRFTQLSLGTIDKSGLLPGDTLGKTRWELPIEGVGEAQWAEHRSLLARHEPFHDFIYRMRTPGKGLRWFSINGRPAFDAEGRFEGYHGTGRDITERVETEARLRRQADLLRAILEHMNQGISVVDANLDLIACNRRFLELLGFPEEFGRASMPFEAFVRYNVERGEYGPGDVERLVRERLQLARTSQPHRFKRVRPGGTVLEVQGTPLPGGGMVTTYSDITEQERIAAQIRQERDFRQHLIESIPGIFYLFDAEGRYLMWNRNHETVSGYTAEEMTTLHPLDLFAGDDRRHIEERIGAVFANGQATAEARLIGKDGCSRPFYFTGQRIALEDGRPALVGVGIDLTEKQQVEDALARQTAVLQATLEAMDQGISVVDGELRMTALNRKFCELLDFPEELARAGANFADFVRFNAMRGEYGPCDIEVKVGELVERARHPQPHRFRRTRPNGRVIEVRGNPMPGGGFVTTYSDVTLQEQADGALRRSEQRFRSIYEKALNGIAFAALDGTLEDANDSLAQLLGYAREELRGMSLARFTHPDDLAVESPFLAEMQAGNRDFYRMDKRYLVKSGGIVWADLLVKLIRDDEGRPLHVVGMVADITERKEAERVIRDLNETLELRVSQRTADLEASNRELESFSYSVSHDLRAPLRALHGFSHLLGEEYARLLDDNGRNYLARIQAASERMGQLIDDLLDLARISRQELKRVPVDLGRIAAEIRESLVEQFPDRPVALRIAPGLQAHADPVLAKALLENLLRNAWKFTAEREHAQVDFGATVLGGEIVFSVRDNGAGFDMAYADKLFKPFQRLHDARRFEGTGIGLAIVHRIVKRHGGRIWAEGATGEGAAFHFTLP